MKAISASPSNLFFKSASAGPLTSVWSAPFLARATCSEPAAKRNARRQLRRSNEESASWQEPIACAALGLVTVSAYAAMIWQFSQF